MTIAVSTQPVPGHGLTQDGAAASGAFVRRWLVLTLVLVAVMVTIGGATRLTGSGLSITEWRPITGAIPPLSDAAWLAEFENYRQIPQYQLMNRGMSLGEFQFIYWWEWGHRQLGRLIGLVYAAGFAWVVLRRMVSLRFGLALFGMGLLLGLQGVIGWIMVASGLQPGMTAVAPVKLTLHLTFACFFFASLVAALGHVRALGPAIAAAPLWRVAAWALVAMVFVQIALGGLVAGSRAGFTYNTWPLIDGALIPPAAVLFSVTPFWENFVDNLALVQLNHRIGAYILFAAAIAWFVAVRRRDLGRSASRLAHAFLAVVTLQAVLGIVTLLLVVPLWAGLAHQALGLVVLGIAVTQAWRLGDPA